MHVVTTPERVQPVAVGAFALVSALIVMVAVSAWGTTAVMIGLTVVIAAGAAAVDAHSGRIPNRLVILATLPTALMVLAELAGGGGVEGVELLGSVVLGVVGLAGPLFVIHLVSPRAIGFGDVKLAAALGAALGLVEPRLGLLALCAASAITAAIGLIGRHKSLPFGPGLVFGTVMALLIAGQLGGVATT